MDSYDKSMYPVVTLPPEIVSEIFVSFLPNYPEPPPKTGPLSPYLLCQICRQWRAVAVSTPDLWRAIPLELSSASSQAFTAAQLELADTWLARSVTRPLSIRLVSKSMYIGTNLRTLLDKILLHCQRWEYLHLVVPSNLLALLDASLPILRGLTIGSSVNSDRLPHVLAPFDRAPNLRSVLFGDAFLVATVALPWAQLTRFEGTCVDPFECLMILVAAPQLVYCQFAVCEPSAVVQPELPTTVVHAGLRHFILDADEVEDDDNLDLTDLLGRLTLPALKTLQVSEPSVSLDALKGFMSRSGCLVELLSITGSLLGQSVYCEAFPSIPAIILL